MDPTSAVATVGGGAGGPYPPNGRLCPHFSWLKILLLKHHATTRQQTMMGKGLITFKYNSPLIFFRFFAKLLATNCCTLIWRNTPSYWHAFTDVSRKRHVSLQNRYRYLVSDYDRASQTGGRDPPMGRVTTSRGRKEYTNFYYSQRTLTVVKNSCNFAKRHF